MQTGTSAALKLEDLAISVASHGLSGDCGQTCFPSASRHSPAGPKGAGEHRSKCWAVSVTGLVGLELIRSRDVKWKKLQQAHVVSVNTALHHRPGQQPALHLHREVTLERLEDLQAGPAGAVHCRKATKVTAAGHHELPLPTRTTCESIV